MGRRHLKPTKSVKRLWRDRVRENSVVKQFGPKNSHSENVVVQRVMIRNILGIMKEAGGGASLVSAKGQNGHDVVTEIPLVLVTGSRRPSNLPQDTVAVPLVESSESINSREDPIRKYIVLPTFDVALKKAEDVNDEAAEGRRGSIKCHIDRWPDASYLMRGVTSQKINVDGQGASLSDSEDKIEVSSVSYLTIPTANGQRRPSTADLVIEKLKVEKVDGGGLSIQGVSLASNCHVTLCVFGTFFLVAGLILSYISFSVNDPKEDEDAPTEKKTEKLRGDTSSVSQMRKIGPSFITIGFLMLILGITFYALAKKINRDEKLHRIALSERQLNQLENSFSSAHAASSPMHTIAPAAHEQYPILSVRRNSWWVDSTTGDFPINPDARDFAVQCPSPYGDTQGVISPHSVSPVPSELKAEHSEPYVDIACFPPPIAKVNSEPSMLPTITGVTPNPEMSQGHSQPSSASQGRSYPGPVLSDNYTSNVNMVPSIQVTAAQPPYTPTSVPKLPRLSRHCSIRMDSRPATADSR